MLALNRYRALLDRFFMLAKMENLATGRLREAVQIKTDTQQLDRLREELQLIHQEKLQLVASVQTLVLASSTATPVAILPQLRQ